MDNSTTGSVAGSVTPTPGRTGNHTNHNNNTAHSSTHNYFTPQQHHRMLSTSLATPLPTPPLTAGFASEYPSTYPLNFSLSLPSTSSNNINTPYNAGFVTQNNLEDVFGTSTAADSDISFGLDMEMGSGMGMGSDLRLDAGMDMELGREMAMDLARLTRTSTDDTLPQFQPSTPMTPLKAFSSLEPLEPFTPSSSYPPLPASTGGRIASLGLGNLSSLNIDGTDSIDGMDGKNDDHHSHKEVQDGFDGEFDQRYTEDDDLFGGHDVFYGGDAAMSSPSLSHSQSQSSGFKYPDPVSYASMPPVSASSARTPVPHTAGPLPPPPFTLPMPTYTPKTYGDLGSPVRRQRTPLSTSMPRDTQDVSDLSEVLPLPHSSAKIDPNDWRARLRYCEQAPNKALLEASMVRLLDFSDIMDERELAERRAANLRFDKIREQRLKDRNNEAAKRSRQRKVARIEAAEQQIASLRRERAQLVGEVASLRRRLASGSMVSTGEPTGVRKLRPTRSMAKLSRPGIEEE